MSDRPLLQAAYYCASVAEFLAADSDAIYGVLGRHHSHAQELSQKSAWLEQISVLKAGLKAVPDAWIALEFAIPRMGKRADAVIILDGVVFVAEFKINADVFISQGDEMDHTRLPNFYDGIAGFLKSCGIRELKPTARFHRRHVQDVPI